VWLLHLVALNNDYMVDGGEKREKEIKGEGEA